MSDRQYPSGAQKRNVQRQKAKRSSALLSNMPKLTAFFKHPETQVASDAKVAGASGSGASSDEGEESSPSEPVLFVDESRATTSTSFTSTHTHSDDTDNDSSTHSSSTTISAQPDPQSSGTATLLTSSDQAAACALGRSQVDANINNLNADPGFWGDIDEPTRKYWLQMGPDKCRNKDADNAASERIHKQQKRYFSKSLFMRKLNNGELVKREWLLYSPSKGTIFCFACKLFGTSCPLANGYSDWKNAYLRLSEHEGSKCHRDAMMIYLKRCADVGCIDHELRNQFDSECAYWREVLRRVVVVVRHLAERGLPFRGDSEIFGRLDNGNFMGTLEVISEFDPFLKMHIEKYGNAGRGVPSYLSSTTCREFIELMGERVLAEIICQIKEAKYFSISVDSTPDVVHTDQLTFIIRYVSTEGRVAERFVRFLPIQSHSGESLFQAVLGVLSDMQLDISNCRGQCYDNAANMSGTYSGLQARIRQINPLAEWVPCAAHTLNLVGINSVNSCFETDAFFTLVQSLFNFAFKSTSRWQTITAGLSANENARIETLKSLSDTRWSAHASATKALHQNYCNIQDSLLELSEDPSQNVTAQREAASYSSKMDELENAFLCNLWNNILQRFHKTSAALQAVELDLCNAVELVSSLRGYVASLRDDFDKFESDAKRMSPTVSPNYKADIHRQKKRKRPHDESGEPDHETSGRDAFRTRVFIAIIDRLVAELDRRYASYKIINQKFGFLNNIMLMPLSDLRRDACELQKLYSGDLEADLVEELVQFRMLIGDNMQNQGTSAQTLLQFLRTRNLLTVFPNVGIALRLYLTLPVTNASGERSFSKLGLVKSRLRSTMGQCRLNQLILMSLESDILRLLDFSSLIDDFSTRKARRTNF